MFIINSYGFLVKEDFWAQTKIITFLTYNNGMDTEYDGAANDVLSPINEEECNTLQNPTGNEVCDFFTKQLLPALKQELDAINTTVSMNIYANDASKCSADDANPTHASMLSRIYRYSQAVACVLCSYDPYLANLLKAGKYPQILMGGMTVGSHPIWVTPDTAPTEGSEKPITSGGVYAAVQNAMMQVWHLWEAHPEFSYYAPNYQDLLTQSNTTAPTNDDTAIVFEGEGGTNQIYQYINDEWVQGEVLGIEGIENFATTHIVKGTYADAGIYYFHDGTTGSWNLLDATVGDLEDRLVALENIYQNAVISTDDTRYAFTTRTTLEDAINVTPSSDRATIVFVTGS